MNDDRALELAPEMLKRAYELAEMSTDTSNQNGAIVVDRNGLVVSGGFNDFPEGVEFTTERASVRPGKYRYYEHSERSAIYNAAKTGVSLNYGVMFCPWAACCPCARAIICAGINTLVMHKQRMAMTPVRWKGDVDQALDMMVETGITLLYYDGPIAAPSIIVNGELWTPNSKEVANIGNHSLDACTEMS